MKDLWASTNNLVKEMVMEVWSRGECIVNWCGSEKNMA